MNLHFTSAAGLAGTGQSLRDDLAQAMIEVGGRIAVDFCKFCRRTSRRSGHEVFE
jgi:hypothetical protein